MFSILQLRFIVVFFQLKFFKKPQKLSNNKFIGYYIKVRLTNLWLTIHNIIFDKKSNLRNA
jgi:hypothetical protein